MEFRLHILKPGNIMTENHIHIDLQDGVLVIRLDSPETRNSLTPSIRDGLARATERAVTDPDVRAVYITGTGKAFCAGGDFKALTTHNDSWSVHNRFRQLAHWLQPLIRLQKPVITGLNGVAVGGGMGLALAGDVIVAAESAKLMAGFMRLGVVPDYGMMYQLPRLVGMGRAKQFIFTNGTWTAEQALELGVVQEVLPDADFDAQALERAKELANGPIEAMGMAKWLMERSFESSFEEMMTFEALAQPLAFRTEAHQEGFGALKAKETPDFPAASKREFQYRHAKGEVTDDE